MTLDPTAFLATLIAISGVSLLCYILFIKPAREREAKVITPADQEQAKIQQDDKFRHMIEVVPIMEISHKEYHLMFEGRQVHGFTPVVSYPEGVPLLPREVGFDGMYRYVLKEEDHFGHQIPRVH